MEELSSTENDELIFVTRYQLVIFTYTVCSIYWLQVHIIMIKAKHMNSAKVKLLQLIWATDITILSSTKMDGRMDMG